MSESNSNGIAIIGIAGRFPGAASVDEFWRNLVAGKESISTFSDAELAASGLDVAALRKDPNYVAARGILQDAEFFDAAFFDINAKQAEIIDPQQRLFLEASWSALEQAGYDPESFSGAVGVYAGMANETYFINNLHSRRDLVDLVGDRIINLGNAKDFLALRVAYKLNLRGPALSINTACSTGLVVVCQACQSLLSYQCDLALAGGVAASFPQRRGVRYQENGIFSPDGHCRPLDVNAQGTVSSEGLGVVVLKRLAEALEDGDHIYAVIKGFGLNNDGSNKVGFTAPSVEGQAEAIAIAQADAGFDPSTISYVECHGTATPIGDPIEIAALTQAFRLHTNENNFCAIGSVKGNIGHTDTAAGVAGLIKTALALKHKTLPASLHFEKPNPKIDFANSPFFVNHKLTEWKAGPTPRRAGVSSFGLGGTNAHVVLEEAPVTTPSGPSRPWQLLLLSAKTAPALEAASTNLLAHLKANPDLNLADAAYTLQTGRAVFQQRRLLVCRDVADAIKALEPVDPKRVVTQATTGKGRPVVFLFSGQGAQYVNMGAELYRSEGVFKEAVDRCAKILLPHLGQDLRQVLFPPAGQEAAAEEQLLQTRITQPALFVFEYALTKLWQSWGVVPAAMLGHSVGSIVAACVAGVFSLEDALAFVARRAELVQAQPKGAMLAVRLPEKEVLALLNPELSIAAINSPSLCVVSGPFEAIAGLEGRLKEQGVAARRLHTSHAFHSAMMDAVLAPLAEFLAGIKLGKPVIPFIADVTGRWITEAEATDAKYWVKHVREAVRFADGVGEVLKNPEYILLEVGPGQTLSPLANQHPGKVAGHLIMSSFSATKEQELAALLNALGRLWLAGQTVDWAAFYKGEKRRRIPLPTYAFQRERFWVEGKRPEVMTPVALPDSGKNPDMGQWFYIPSWRRSVSLQLPHLTTQCQNWLVFLDDSGLGAAIAERLQQASQRVTKVRAGSHFFATEEGDFIVNPALPEDYEELIKSLQANNRVPQKIVYLWSITSNRETPSSAAEAFEEDRKTCFDALLFLAQAFGRKKITDPIRITVIANDVHEVTGQEMLRPGKAMLLGPCKVIPQEQPNFSCMVIDAILPQSFSSDGHQLVEQMMPELLGMATEPVIAFRGKHRWVQQFDSIRLNPPAKTNSRLRDKGVYLITGGFGKIGLLLAEHLAKNYKAKLILMGRSIMPPREKWSSWLEMRGPDDPVSRKILKLKKLEEWGSEVIFFTINAADKAAVVAGIAAAEKKLGVINGVFHAAGVLDRIHFSSALDYKGPSGLPHFEAKVYGLMALAEALKGRDLDFILLFSSLSTVLGGLGMAAYASANQFMDAYAAADNRSSGTPWISVNWEGWTDDRANASPSSSGIADKFSVTPEQGIDVLRQILDQPHLDQVIVSTGDLHSRLKTWLKPEADKHHEPPKTSDEPASLHSRPSVSTRYVPAHNDTEKALTNIWGALLGIQQIGADDNFFDLGGDSLLLMQLQVKIRQELGADLSSAEMFQYSTISAMAKRLGQATEESPELEAIHNRAQRQRAVFAPRPQIQPD